MSCSFKTILCLPVRPLLVTFSFLVVVGSIFGLWHAWFPTFGTNQHDIYEGKWPWLIWFETNVYLIYGCLAGLTLTCGIFKPRFFIRVFTPIYAIILFINFILTAIFLILITTQRSYFIEICSDKPEYAEKDCSDEFTEMILGYWGGMGLLGSVVGVLTYVCLVGFGRVLHEKEMAQKQSKETLVVHDDA